MTNEEKAIQCATDSKGNIHAFAHLAALEMADWKDEQFKQLIKSYKEETNPVSIYELPDGKKVIRVRTYDEDFLLDPKHIDNGKWYKFDEAMERLKELGLTTFNKKQACIISTYHEEIDAAIEVLDGDKLEWEWSLSEYSPFRAWWYFSVCGTVNHKDKDNKSKVRPIYKLNDDRS